MDTNDEVRRRRLKELCDNFGGVRDVAAKAEMHWQTLDQILKRVLLPQKADGTRSPRSLGDDAARKLEAVYDLGTGWFDWPFQHVDFKQWADLDGFQRAYVEGQLEVAIRDASKKVVPAQVKKRAVTDKKVEKHYPALPPGEAKAAHQRAASKSRVSVDVPSDDLFTDGPKK